MWVWFGLVVFKYYFGECDDWFCLFVGFGISYMCFMNMNLNLVFQCKLVLFGGLFVVGVDIGSLQLLLFDLGLFQWIWDVGGDLLLLGWINVLVKVKSVWELVFIVGVSYQIMCWFWIIGMVIYILLCIRIMFDISQLNCMFVLNMFDILVNLVLVIVLLNFCF